MGFTTGPVNRNIMILEICWLKKLSTPCEVVNVDAKQNVPVLQRYGAFKQTVINNVHMFGVACYMQVLCSTVMMS